MVPASAEGSNGVSHHLLSAFRFLCFTSCNWSLFEETMLSDKTGRVLVALALFIVVLTLTVGSVQLLMRIAVLR
jgi:hypothetical protein